MTPTADPEVMIESQSGGSVVYVRSDGRRWRVTGKCERKGLCLVGAVIDGVLIESVGQLGIMCLDRGQERIDSELDVPLGPGYDGNCCPMTVHILN